jgi:hypothetical protein
MTTSPVLATTVLGLNWYVLLLLILAVLVVLGFVAAALLGGKAAGRGRRGPG